MIAKGVVRFPVHARAARVERKAFIAPRGRSDPAAVVGEWHRNPASGRIELSWHAAWKRHTPAATVEPPSSHRRNRPRHEPSLWRRATMANRQPAYGACA